MNKTPKTDATLIVEVVADILNISKDEAKSMDWREAFNKCNRVLRQRTKKMERITAFVNAGGLNEPV